MTAPNVLIWSAAVASCSSMGLYERVILLAKDSNGDIVHWSPSEIKWNDAVIDENEPETRLAELFNVNHFIISQATPYIAPFISRGPQNKDTGIFGKLSSFLTMEIRHRIQQLGKLKLFPSSFTMIVDKKSKGNVTIAPPISHFDFYTLFSSPTVSSLHYWILKGERATWPFLSLIRSRLHVELALEKGK